MCENNTTLCCSFLNIHFPLSKLKSINLSLFKTHEVMEPSYLLFSTVAQSGKAIRDQKLHVKGQIWKFTNINPPSNTKISA